MSRLKSTSYSKKYGCSLARFTHKPTSIIYASTKGDDAIRYMSFHDNKFLRYFKGHTKKVVGLEMSPQDDTFLSASLDDSVRLWDLRSPNCCGLMRLSGNLGYRPCIAYDQDCTIFAAGIHSKLIRLYDVKAYDKGPFTSFSINDPELQRAPEWTHIKFSNDGKYILVVTNSEILYMIDAFTGHVKHKLSGHLNQSGLDIDANFTPDVKYVYSGSQDGNIYFWETETGKQVTVLEGHTDPSVSVAWNPKYLMFASADSNLVFDFSFLKNNFNSFSRHFGFLILFIRE